MTFQLLVGICAALWLASLIVCALAWRWSAVGANRFITSIVLCILALCMGYYGLTHFHITASKTVNGQTQWAFNSRWFFIATLVCGTLTLAYTLWKHRKTTSAL